MPKSNEDIARDNLARQSRPEREPKRNEPGFTYNEDGAQIENPGPTSGPKFSEGRPIGYPQLGDRVVDRPAPETVKQPSGDEVNLGDKDGGRPMTANAPGSSSVVKTQAVDGKKGDSRLKAGK